MAEDREELTRRAAFLTDGVIAIAMTLLALDLRPDLPADATSGQLGHFLRTHAGEYEAFAIAFYLIAGYWRNHHRVLENATLGDELCVTLNMFFLFAITLVPVTSFIQGDYTTSLGRSIFAANLALVGLTLGALQERIIRRGYASVTDTPEEQLARRIRLLFTFVVLGIVAGLAWVIQQQSGYVYLLIIVASRTSRLVAGEVEKRRERRPRPSRRKPPATT